MSKINNEIISSTHYLPYETENIDYSLVLENCKEIKESVESREKCLELLRNELKGLLNIDSRLDDSFLLCFLRVSKFNVPKALQRIQAFYQQYDAFLETFEKCSMPLKKAQRLDHLRISPYRLKNNSVLLMAYNEKIDYKKYTFGERYYTEIVVAHKLAENPLTQICGGTCLIDYQGFNIHGVLAHTPGWVRLYLSFFMGSFPCRLKAVHLVNVPPVFSSVFKLIQTLLPKKMKERVFLHSRGDFQDLLDYIPPEVLPEKFGGRVKDADLINCMGNMEDLENDFLKSFAFGSLKNQERRKAMKVLY